MSARSAAGEGLPRGAVRPPGPVLVGRWSKDERDRVEAVLRRLPLAVLTRGSRRVVRDRERCEPDGLPRDEDLIDPGGDVHLCSPTDEGRALDIGQQVALGLLFGLDRAIGWSDQAAWRDLNGWRQSILHPLHPTAENHNPDGFLSPRGERSPRWDLVAFTAALLLDEGRASSVGCRMMSQAAFVRDRLAGLEPRTAPVPPPSCPEFERWADLDRLSDVEVVLATPSTAMVASLFGHVFLRLVYRDEAGDAPLHLSSSIAFLAENEVPFSVDPDLRAQGDRRLLHGLPARTAVLGSVPGIRGCRRTGSEPMAFEPHPR